MDDPTDIHRFAHQSIHFLRESHPLSGVLASTRGVTVAKARGNIPRRRLGRYLRDLRQQSNLTLADAAKRIGRGAGTLQRLETGDGGKIVIADIENLCELYGAQSMLDGLKGLAQQANAPAWWHEYSDLFTKGFDLYVDLEATAETLMVYRPDIISGLFQTTEYARTLDRNYFPDDSPAEIERRVQLRVQRQRLITRKLSPAQVDLIVDEGVLRRVVGGAKTMSGQLLHLASLPPTVTVRVLPSAVGFPLGVSPGPFTVMDFGKDNRGYPIEPTVVYVEAYTGAMYYERADIVRRYRAAHRVLRQVALDESRSKNLLRQVAKEYAP
ncbi:helix-turn-helix domain-containing protein [Nocardia abscessus]|uniref:Helix-turn-helix domain-containing protein n=1 Tax=Nocardia abscessus TaxID=120957 RepID=A0ABS0C385_9NOCA|nr:helix-turn-helix transcriptional regulator [Nocardia abscessus]MBF6224845.1 helix-turn-helix domain-containing protein [Nocardia abscessus]